MKSSVVFARSINRFPSTCRSSLMESSLYGIDCNLYFHKFKEYNNWKVTVNMCGFLSMCTSSNSDFLETVAEAQKYSTSIYRNEDNRPASRKFIEEKEFIKFITNDKFLFERAVSFYSLKEA